MIGLLAFYLFATLTIASALLVIFSRNPVHSVLWLIVAFFNAAGLMPRAIWNSTFSRSRPSSSLPPRKGETIAVIAPLNMGGGW